MAKRQAAPAPVLIKSLLDIVIVFLLLVLPARRIVSCFAKPLLYPHLSAVKNFVAL
jgi:hypothetical protein